MQGKEIADFNPSTKTMNSTTNKGWVGFDLDGCLAHYDKWRGVEHIGEPIKPMVDLLKQYLEHGVEVRIFTARVYLETELTDGSPTAEIKQADLVRTTITQWCEKHIGRVLPVTCTKDMDMILLHDDRCIQVEQNTGIILVDYYQSAADTMNASLEEIRAALGVAKQSEIMGEIRRLVK